MKFPWYHRRPLTRDTPSEPRTSYSRPFSADNRYPIMSEPRTSTSLRYSMDNRYPITSEPRTPRTSTSHRLSTENRYPITPRSSKADDELYPLTNLYNSLYQAPSHTCQETLYLPKTFDLFAMSHFHTIAWLGIEKNTPLYYIKTSILPEGGADLTLYAGPHRLCPIWASVHLGRHRFVRVPSLTGNQRDNQDIRFHRKHVHKRNVYEFTITIDGKEEIFGWRPSHCREVRALGCAKSGFKLVRMVGDKGVPLPGLPRTIDGHQVVAVFAWGSRRFRNTFRFSFLASLGGAWEPVAVCTALTIWLIDIRAAHVAGIPSARPPFGTYSPNMWGRPTEYTSRRRQRKSISPEYSHRRATFGETIGGS